MVARGLMTPEQALGHPMGHILSRAVGVQKEVEVDRVDGEVQSGDIFLLCSDGLHGVVDDERDRRPFRPRGAGAGARPARRADPGERRAGQCHRDRDLGQRPDPSLLCGSQAMSDEKDKNPPGTPETPEGGEERTVFMPGGFTLPPPEGQEAEVPAPEPPAPEPAPEPSPRRRRSRSPRQRRRRRSPRPSRSPKRPPRRRRPAPTGAAAAFVPHKDAVGIKVGDVPQPHLRGQALPRPRRHGRGVRRLQRQHRREGRDQGDAAGAGQRREGDRDVPQGSAHAHQAQPPALVQYRVLAQEPQLHVLYIVTDFIEGTNLSVALGTI